MSSAAPLSPTSTTSSVKLRRDTGFPEPFCGSRNTTLPHPEANLSPDATLEASDIDPSRALTRTRRSFLAKKSKYRHTLSHGKIAPTTSTDSGLSHDSDPDAGGSSHYLEEIHVVMLPDGRISKDGEFSRESIESAMDGTESQKKKKPFLKRVFGQ
ncbi:hypothetical protein SAPIO_CDS10669 [Scedosporium apiospermum]|uniref:Uncharacterized protein n=1 Tax=Pseudallescheria apiosperma TaxID=563466 RepID=A0A084FU95_PSEDA|nr:uncharacterized protein SAPIO_CDS10669 [Scedosporium apiospermum]KEZ38657.1 hypothetical protein SAPIO_CDS10669 [Scedosporium apiospermum]